MKVDHYTRGSVIIMDHADIQQLTGHAATIAGALRGGLLCHN
jgi:hypothetical protein